MSTGSNKAPSFLHSIEVIAVVVGVIAALWFGWNQLEINQKLAESATRTERLHEVDVNLATQQTVISGLKFAAEASTLLQGDVIEANATAIPQSFDDWSKCHPVGEEEANKPRNAASLLRVPPEQQKRFRLRPKSVASRMLVTVAIQQADAANIEPQKSNKIHTANNEVSPNHERVVQLLLPLIHSPDPSSAAGALMAVSQLTSEEGRKLLDPIENAVFSSVVFKNLRTEQLNYFALPNSNFSYSVFPNDIEIDSLNCTNCKLNGTLMSSLRLSECNFDGSRGLNSIFKGTKFLDCKFGRSDAKVEYTSSNFSGVTVNSGNFVGNFTTKCEFGGATFSNVVMKGSEFESAFSAASLKGAEDFGSTATESDASIKFLGKTDLESTVFDNSTMPRAFFGSEAKLRGASFANAELISSCFSGVKVPMEPRFYPDFSISFSGASMQNSILAKAMLRNADFYGAHLQGAKFNEAHVEWSNFVDAAFDANTDFRDSHLAYCILSGTSEAISIDYEKTDGVKLKNNSLKECEVINGNGAIFLVEPLVDKNPKHTHVFMGSLQDLRKKSDKIPFQLVPGYQDVEPIIFGDDKQKMQVKEYLAKHKVLVDSVQAKKVIEARKAK